LILVLGGSSFSGDAYVAHRLNCGDRVASFERTEHDKRLFSAMNQSLHNRYHRIPFNLNTSTQQIVNFVNENRVEVIVNFAAQSMVGQSWDNSEDWYEANVSSLAKLANKLNSETKLRKFIQFSTPEVYGSTNGWLKESFDFNPNSPYAISRAAGDWHLKALHENSGFPVIFTRAANVFGEHQQLYRIVPKVIISALTGRKLPLQGGGNSIRSFIHIQDVNRALDLIISQGKIGESYHISTTELISIHNLVESISAKLKINFQDFVEITPDRLGKDYAYQLDSGKIRSELNWSEEISLDLGLERTITWVKKNLEFLKQIPTEYSHRK
jgi:dTDP-glucose 4,6-dehydratase